MFEGIVIGLGRVADVEVRGSSRRIGVDLGELVGAVEPGGSIAINGACLTSIASRGSVHSFDVIDETLRRTNLGELVPGDQVNVERPLRLGAPINGHLVEGHVDGTAEIVERREQGEDVRVWLELGPEQLRYVAPKGSIAIDGVSLTVVDVDRDASRFSVALIPFTLGITTLGFKQPGARVNIEVDHQAKLHAGALEATLALLRAEIAALARRVAALEKP